MIPKIIHYCWFGGNPLPELAVKCIESWKRFCPDYQIIEWNESNFDINCCTYVKEAYKAKKWAFVSDYARLKAMTEFGGIYMDTDVEVLKPLDEFLQHKAFSGFETPDAIPTGIMACEKDFPLFRRLLADYDSRSFVLPNGQYDQTTNVQAITEACLEYGLILNNTKQDIEGFVLYPKDFFCPKSYTTGLINITDNTYTIHHFSGSWLSGRKLFWRDFSRKILRKHGEVKGKRILSSLPMRAAEALITEGFGFALGRLKLRITKKS